MLPILTQTIVFNEILIFGALFKKNNQNKICSNIGTWLQMGQYLLIDYFKIF